MQCDHELCNCTIKKDSYCGPTCRQGISDPESTRCLCGHADCTNTEGRG